MTFLIVGHSIQQVGRDDTAFWECVLSGTFILKAVKSLPHFQSNMLSE